jgi:hypothetical protein
MEPTDIVFVVSSYVLPGVTMSREIVGFWMAWDLKCPENSKPPATISASKAAPGRQQSCVRHVPTPLLG